jgi:hypothetical protein
VAEKKTPAEITAEYTAKHAALEAEAAAIERLEGKSQKYYELQVRMLETLKEGSKLTGEYADYAKDFEESIGLASVALKDFNETQAAATKSQDDFSNALGRTIKTFTGVTDASDTLIGSFFKLTQTEEGTAEAAGLMKDAFKKTFTALNVGVSISRKMMESTFAMAKANDQATAAFNKSTGAAGAYDRELVALQQSNIANGISTAEMGESYQALMGNLSGFGVMAQSERMRLGELGAQFAKVGVSGADFAGTLQTMTRGFGMSTRAATGMQEEAMELAQTLGKDVGQVMSELNAALPQLASYGDDAVDMFFDLEKQAQRTGLAVGELISIAGNYRTFDSAATAAGNLNAVLGTQLFSTMGLLESQLEGPEAVIEYMSGALSDSIGDWDSLNTFQKEAVANAAGMNMEQMNHLMNQKNMTAEERERAASLDESMAAGRDLWQEMTLFAQQFAMEVQPLVEALTTGFQAVNAVLQGMRDNFFSLGEIIAFVFATTSIFKFITAMRTMKTVQKQINAVNKQGAIISAAKAAFAHPIQALASLALAGVAVAAVKGMMPKESHARGTDRTSGRMALVGEEGPELLVPPPNAAVVNNTTMTALAEQGAAGGGGDNAQVVAAVRALGAKMDTMITKLGSSGDFVMQVDRQEFGRVINQHLGEEGSAPLRLKLA